MIKETTPLFLTEDLQLKAIPHDWESWQIYLIHRNKHKETAKVGRQRNRSQMKEQEKYPEKELNEMEASHLSDTEFKVMVIRMLKGMKKDIETIKEDQSEMKNTISGMKNTLEGINSRLDEAQDKIRDLENKVERNSQSEKQKEKRIFKNEDSLRDLDDMNHNNIYIIGIAEGEEREQGIKKLSEEIMVKTSRTW